MVTFCAVTSGAVHGTTVTSTLFLATSQAFVTFTQKVVDWVNGSVCTEAALPASGDVSSSIAPRNQANVKGSVPPGSTVSVARSPWPTVWSAALAVGLVQTGSSALSKV